MKQNVAFQESTQWMESKYATMPPGSSKLTTALKMWQNLHTRSNLVKKNQSRIRFLEIQLINITSGIESVISGGAN